MKFFNVLMALLFFVELGVFSSSRLHAQTAATPAKACPGMNGGGMGQHGMMGSGMTMHGMHGAADEAYMQSMMSMHQQMHGESMSGNPDRDFMIMMIPHHQAAIDMARAELKYGTNPKLRAMAQNIIKAQQAEIDQMRAMLR